MKLVWVILSLSALGLSFYLGTTIKDSTPIYNTEEVDSLYKANAFLSNNIAKRDSSIMRLEQKVLVLDGVVLANKAKIQQIRKDLQNETKKIKTYSATDINSFLDKRYSAE